jgi:hypothetical protein
MDIGNIPGHWLLSCLEALRVEAGQVGGREREGEPGGEQDVVVVWASDHDTLAEPLLQQLVANPHVSVVLLEHYLRDESVGRMDDRHVSSSSMTCKYRQAMMPSCTPLS